MNAQEWEEVIQEYRESGMSIVEWCKQKGYNVGTFKNRLYRKPNQLGTAQFIEVKPAKVSKLKIELTGGASILIDEYTDMNMVNKLLRALK